ncbi:MAG: DUF4173 domain-containing protein, partial [Verrucomicrobiota bacterium]|nr:DUF4173 domain-containing protein [Verrucomicrobiota bacterium]
MNTVVDSKRACAHAAFVLAMVALADWFFYGHSVGWTLGAYGIAAGAGIVGLGGGQTRTRAAAWLGAAYLLLCLRAVVEPETPVVLLGVAALLMLTLTLRGGWSWRLTLWGTRGLWFTGELIISSALAVAGVLVLPFVPVYAAFHVKRARVWLVPLVLGVVFLALFALANPVISLALSSLWGRFVRVLRYLPSVEAVTRLLLWLLTGALLWTFLRHRPRSAEEAPLPPPLPESAGVAARLLDTEVVRNALIVFNVLFVLQSGLDAWYLWGGGTLPEGLTYAGYAHRGAYPLIATALLAAAFVLAAFREGASWKTLGATRWLVFAWLAQNVLLVFSAGWRLKLYVAVFSLTRWRLAAGVWMALVACGLLWILVRIATRRSNAWLVRVNVITALVAVTAYTCWTPRMFIADFNVRHCLETGQPDAQPLDLNYLERLGLDALPALVRLEGQVRGGPREYPVRQAIQRLSRELESQTSDWRGFTPKRRYLRDTMTREGYTLGVRGGEAEAVEAVE